MRTRRSPAPEWNQALPALPRAWAEGSYQGLRARGGVTVDVMWAGGHATKAVLRPSVAGHQRIRIPLGQSVGAITAGGKPVTFKQSRDLVEVMLEPGTYELTFR